MQEDSIAIFEQLNKTYKNQFMKIFDSDFDIIAGDNPREFLKHVL